MTSTTPARRHARAARAAVAAVVAAVVGLAAAMPIASGTRVFTLDCEGGAHIWTGAALETNINMKGAKEALNMLGEQWLERASCACAEAGEAELKRRFVPSVEFFVSALAHHDNGEGGYATAPINQQNSCPGEGVGVAEGVQAVFGAVSSAFPFGDASTLSGFEMPATCSYESVMNGDGCQFTMHGMTNNTWLKSPTSQLNVIIDKCEDSITWPFISVECEGDGCDEVFVQPCETDADCTTEYQTCKGFFGNTTEDAIQIMTDLGFTSGEDSYNCITEGASFELPFYADPILTGIFGFNNDLGVPSLELRTCTQTFYELADMVHQGLFSDDGSDDGGDSYYGGGYEIYGGGDSYGDGNSTDGSSSDGSSSSTSGALLGFLNPPFQGDLVLTPITDPSTVLPGFDLEYCASLGCHPFHVGDGYCNPKCNVPECLYDGNECANCECVSGTDYSSCNKTSYEGFFVGDFSTFVESTFGGLTYAPNLFPAARPTPETCAVDTETILTPWDIVAECPAFYNALGGPAEWFCTVGGEQNDGTIPAGTLLFSASSFGSRFDCRDGAMQVSRQRLCTCAYPAQVDSCSSSRPFEYSIAMTVAGELPAENVTECGPAPSFETCPYATLETVVPPAGLLAPLARDPSTFDKAGASLLTPEVAAADTNVLYTTCDGTLVANLFNPFLGVAVAMPNLNTTLSLFKDAVRALDACASYGSSLSGAAAIVAYDFWTPAFWLEALMPGSYLTSRANTTLGYKFQIDEPIVFPNVPDLTVENLLAGPASPVRFEISLAEPFGVSQFDVAVEIAECAGSELSQLKVAVDAPFITDVTQGISTCADTLLDTCPASSEDAFCFDFKTLLSNISATLFDVDTSGAETMDDMYDVYIGELGGLFDVFVWREVMPPPTLCQNLDDRFTLLSARRLLFDLIFADGESAPSAIPSLTEQLLYACLPQFFQTIDSLFSEASVECNSLDGGGYGCYDGETPEECAAKFSSETYTQCSNSYSGFEYYPTCSTPIERLKECDEVICVGFLDPETNYTGLTYFPGYSQYDNYGGLVMVSGMDNCRASCAESFPEMFQTECYQVTTQCTDLAAEGLDGNYRCERDPAWSSINYYPNTNTNVFSGNCTALFPYAYFDSSMETQYCCSRNDNGDDIATRLGDGWLCEGVHSESPCEGCNDFVMEAAEVSESPGYCEWDVPFYPCNSPTSVTIDGEPSYAYIPGTAEGCAAFCLGYLSLDRTCECTITEVVTCDTIPRVTDCYYTSQEGQGTAWAEAQRAPSGVVLQLDPDDESSLINVTYYSFSAFTSRAAEVPGSLYTAVAPIPLTATFTEDGVGIKVTFDSATNQELGDSQSGVADCGNIIVISGATEASNMVCYWTSSTVLFVSLSAQSEVGINDELSFLNGNGIRAAVGYSPETSGTLVIGWPGTEYPTPVISLRGLAEVSPCEELVSLTGTIISGAAGRALKWNVSIIEVETPIFTLTGATSQLFDLTFTETGVAQGGSYTAVATAVNWLGQVSAEASWDFTVATTDIPTITIESASATIQATRGVTRVTVDATTRFLCGAPTATYEYAWTYSDDNWATSTALGAYTATAYRRFKADTFPVGTHQLRVTTRVVGDPSTEARDEIALTVSSPALALVPTGGFYRAIFANEALTVDFSRSCDPAAALGCDPVYGATTGSASALTPFLSVPTVLWACSRSDGQLCGLSLPLGGLTFTVPQGSLVADVRYVFTVQVNGQTSNSVTIAVRPAVSASCAVIPSVSIAPVDPVLTVTSAGVVLKGAASSYVPGAASNPVKLLWQRMVENPETSLLEPTSATPFSDVVNRPQLLLRRSSLSPGVTYTFRLTARQTCTEPDNHPYAQVTFTVNKPPTNGFVSSDLTTGFAYDTEFTLAATGFSDENTPLTYSFEYTFEEPTGVLQPEDTYSLGPFSASPTLRTVLELPVSAAGVNGSGVMYVTVVARDALGAESQRLNFLPITLRNPIKSPLWSPPNFASELQNTIAEGGKAEDLLRSAMSLGSLVNSASSSGTASLEDWASDTRNAALGYLEGVNVTEKQDPYLVSLQINLLLTLVSGNPSDIDTDFQDQSLMLLRRFIDEANQTIAENTRSEDDAGALGILPSSVQGNTLESLTRILEAARQSLESSARRLSGRERMLADDQACGVVNLTRTTIEELARLSLQNYVEGAAARQFQSTGIQLATARENTDALGSGSDGGDGLSSMPLPGAKATGKSSSSNSTSSSSSRGSFLLPADLVDGIDFGDAGRPNEIDLIAVSYSMNIRCEVVFNVTLIDADGNEDECNLTSELVQYTGPVSEVTDVVTLDFVDSADPSRFFDPTGLEEGITIQVPRSEVTDADLCTEVENATEIVCGFFDPESNEWSTAGCQLSGNQTDPDSYVTCVCNHASDYAVWHAFTDDVRQTFTDPITAVTSIALFLLGVFFPSILFVWFVGLYWANRRDKLDANSIQKGAVGMMYLRRMQARAQQRRFFANLKAMVEEQKSVADLESYKHLQSNPRTAPPFFRRSICRNFFLAIIYEHSLLGLIRYDAHYSRMQRVSIFVAICMGNALAAAIFFELKTADDVSAGFLVGTIIMCSLFVSIPVRILVKTLFRISKLEEGSRGSRVSTAFRALSRVDERPMDEAEVALLISYNRVFTAKSKVAALRAQIRLAKSSGGGSTHTGSTALVTVADDHDPEMAPEGVTLEELEKRLAEAQSDHAEAKRKLIERTRTANESWKNMRTQDAITRINRVRKQKSALLRVTALLADETQVVGKPRRPLLSAWFKYVAWIFMFAFYAFAAYYVTRFVLTRADRVGAGNAENEILLIWLGTAASGVIIGYVVAEPTIFFLRYAVFPYILIRFGHNTPDDDEDASLIRDEQEDDDSEDMEQKRKSRLSNYLYDDDHKRSGEKKKGGSDNTILLELAADLLEAGL